MLVAYYEEDLKLKDFLKLRAQAKLPPESDFPVNLIHTQVKKFPSPT